MHSGEDVSIFNADSGTTEQVSIQGLDSNGYLAVRSKQTGKLFGVQDDGNSFDLMKGLIHPKN